MSPQSNDNNLLSFRRQFRSVKQLISAPLSFAFDMILKTSLISCRK